MTQQAFDTADEAALATIERWQRRKKRTKLARKDTADWGRVR